MAIATLEGMNTSNDLNLGPLIHGLLGPLTKYSILLQVGTGQNMGKWGIRPPILNLEVGLSRSDTKKTVETVLMIGLGRILEKRETRVDMKGTTVMPPLNLAGGQAMKGG